VVREGLSYHGVAVQGQGFAGVRGCG
jgi:hypothetical protein